MHSSLLRSIPLVRPIRLQPFSIRAQSRTITFSNGLYARKTAQDRESIDTEATEYSKSGSDDAAAHNDTAFKPGKTKPEEELGQAENGVYNTR
jgi:hypothetical protein